MPPTLISASLFKAKCLALLDEVAQGGPEIVVTKHGKPVARIVAVEPAPSLIGSVTQHVSDEELIAPIDQVWNAQRA